jgi:hypothetical protein
VYSFQTKHRFDESPNGENHEMICERPRQETSNMCNAIAAPVAVTNSRTAATTATATATAASTPSCASL